FTDFFRTRGFKKKKSSILEGLDFICNLLRREKGIFWDSKTFREFTFITGFHKLNIMIKK
ncbi:hypothetical protein DRN58_03575, partial [Thermococci archaeon]